MSWMTYWSRRKKITVTGSTDGVLSDFQIKFTVVYESDMNSDFSDLRFTDVNGVSLSYWIESKTDESTADVWVKIRSIGASPDSTYIYMYYGNSSVSSDDSGANTFIQYHSSATAAYHDTNTFLNNIIYESRIKRTAATHSIRAGVSDEAGIAGDTIQSMSYSAGNERFLINKNDGTQTAISEAPTWSLDTYVKLKITFDGSNIHGYVDDDEISTGNSTNLPNENMGLWLYITSGTVVQDWSFVREYTANEPTYEIDLEEHAPGNGRIVDVRCIIQRDNTEKDKYYPGVVSAFTNKTFPHSIPTATIELNTNISSGSSGYMSPVRMDDIVRLQVNVKNTAAEKNVWQDLFEGRIYKIEPRFSSNNNTVLFCLGHADEIRYSAITADYSASAATTGTNLNAIRAAYLDRLTDAGSSLIDTAGSTNIAEYNIQQDTKYVIDVVKDSEALESWGYVFSIVTSYDTDDNLSAADISWQAVSSTASTQVQVIEGTPRLISASFPGTIEQLINDVTVYGATGAPQKVGAANDATSITAYDRRYHIETDTTLTTNDICGDFAAAILARYKDYMTTGAVTILGDPNVSPADLIYCRIPSIELEGSTIDGNYRCGRVSHSISSRGFFTMLDLGEVQISPFEMIAGFHAKSRLTNANFIE